MDRGAASRGSGQPLLSSGPAASHGLAGDTGGHRCWQGSAGGFACTLPLERLQVIVPALAATDPFRLHLDRPWSRPARPDRRHDREPAWLAARDLRQAGGQRPPGRWRRGSPPRCARGPVPAAGLIRVLNAALVLVADHELAASTLAVRVAASMRADPYAVVATGLGAMGGALHGGAALGAELMLGAASSAADAPRVVGDLLRRGERLPGFGHFVYTRSVTRARTCCCSSWAITRPARHSSPSPWPSPTRPAACPARAQHRVRPGGAARVAGMVRGAGEAIFATGRSAGWLAHALEEYERNIPIRPRGVYTGQSAT